MIRGNPPRPPSKVIKTTKTALQEVSHPDWEFIPVGKYIFVMMARGEVRLYKLAGDPDEAGDSMVHPMGSLESILSKIGHTSLLRTVEFRHLFWARLAATGASLTEAEVPIHPADMDGDIAAGQPRVR